MGKGEKVVIDTNIFISAFGWGGKPLKIIGLLEKGVIRNCISSEILAELSRSVSYPKLEFPQEIQTNILEFVLAYSDIYAYKKYLKVTNDPGDNKFIECALSANAKFVITGDKSLLSVKKYKDIEIITPEDFIKERKL